jgi:O-antigen ligase
MVLLMPFFLTSRKDVVSLFRWIGGISVFFILFLVPFVFSKSVFAAFWLQRFGLYVATFDNGWLRFVVLPGFGLNLLMLSLCPNILPASKWIRASLGLLGVVAIVMGGNRSSLVMAFIMVLAIAVARRRIVMASIALTASALLLVTFSYVGEKLDIRGGVGFSRVMSLTSRRIAEASGASGTAEWRMIRWKRAMQEIQAHPVFGKGYGGVENAWLFTDWAEFEEATVEIALASGGIHNGYLNAAYSLGIPALLLFIVIVVGQSLSNFRQAQRLLRIDPIKSEMHSLVLANLGALTAAIYIGIDLNAPMLWLYLILGVFLTRLGKENPAVVEDAISAPAHLEPRALPA